MKHWRLAVAALMCISAFAQLQQNVKPAIATTVAPTYLNSTNVFLSTDLTGSLRIACITGCTSGSSGTSSTFGAAFPATGTAAGFIGSTGNMAGGNLTAAGALKTDASATTQPVSGTISATQGTSPWVVSGTVSATQGTNPWVVSGTVTANQGTSPWITAGGGTAGTAATGVVTVQGIASMTKLLVTPDSVALPANQSVNVSQINGVTPLMGNGVTGTGSPRVTIASDNTAFTVNAAESGTWTVQPGNTANTTPWLVQNTPGTTNGLTTFTLQPAASDNHTVVKNGAALLYHVSVFNNSATINYLRIYDAGTGFNGCNSATNLKWSTMIPASTSAAGYISDVGLGIGLTSGLSICVTSVYGNTDTTNATASALLVNLGYK